MTDRPEASSDRPLVQELGEGSPYRRYLQMFVGRESFAAFLRYELLTGLLGPMPGAAGYWLRARLYPGLLGRLGRGSVIGRSVVLRSPHRIALGERVLVDDGVVLDAKGERSAIRLGNDILLGRGTILSCNQATIETGDMLSIGPFCFFACKGRTVLGSNVAMGAGTYLMAGGHVSDDPETPILQQARTAQGITVEDNVWIGAGVKILDGVTVGRNSILAAGAVVSKDVPAYSLVMGNPARVVEKRK
jgi:acetyltransferase-like isoleucine patch superfamily enzyme